MLPKEKEGKNSTIPPQIKLYFTNFKTVSQSHCYQTFNAVSNFDSKVYTIRVLDVNSEFYKHSPNAAATLFIQELLRLSVLQPSAVLIQHFEVYENLMAFVTTGYCPLDSLIKDTQNSKQLDYEQLIKDIRADLHFLHTDLKFPSKIDMDLENIYHLSSNNRFFLGNWSKSLEKIESGETKSTFGKDVSSFETDDINTLACKILESIGVKKDDINDLINTKNPKMYKSSLEIVINELEVAESLKQTLKNMLSRDTEIIKKMSEFMNIGRDDALMSDYSLKNDSKKSGIRIKVGDLPQGEEKTSGKATLNFGKKAEETQREKLKTILEIEDVSDSWVLILRPIEGKTKDLETVINEFLHQTLAYGFIFKTFLSDSKLIVHIKPKDALKHDELVQILHNLASKEQFRLDCNITSASNFLNVLEYQQKDYSTPFAFICKPLMMELSVTPEEELFQISYRLFRLLELFTGVNHNFNSDVLLQFLKLLKAGNINLALNEIKDLTDPFKLSFENDPFLFFPKNLKTWEDSTVSLLFGKIIEILQSDVEVYLNWEEILAIHMQIKAPGFGVALNTPLENK